MNSILNAEYTLLKKNLLFIILVISAMFVSLAEKSEAFVYNDTENIFSFSKTATSNVFFADCSFDLSDALPAHLLLDTDKNPYITKKHFSYLRFPNETQSDITYSLLSISPGMNQFRSTVLRI